MDIGEKEETPCPSVKSVKDGAALVLIQYDDVVDISDIVDSNRDPIYIISKNQRGDDGLISAIRPTGGSEIGEHKSLYTSSDGGLVYNVAMSVSLRPAKKRRK